MCLRFMLLCIQDFLRLLFLAEVEHDYYMKERLYRYLHILNMSLTETPHYSPQSYFSDSLMVDIKEKDAFNEELDNLQASVCQMVLVNSQRTARLSSSGPQHMRYYVLDSCQSSVHQ